MKNFLNSALIAVVLLSTSFTLMAQPQGKGKGGKGKGKGFARGPALSVTSNAFPDGGVIPLKNAFRGDNMSPDFEFHWNMGTEMAQAPAGLQSYAVIFHDIENSTAMTTQDTLHWSAFNIPGNAKGLPAGLGTGTLADGTVNGPGIANRNGNPGAYFGPGAGPGPYHHYVFEFYALDTNLSLDGSATREQLVNAMNGHIIGKAAYVGRFRTEQ